MKTRGQTQYGYEIISFQLLKNRYSWRFEVPRKKNKQTNIIKNPRKTENKHEEKENKNETETTQQKRGRHDGEECMEDKEAKKKNY